MGKETKLGLVMIVGLLVLFGYVLYRRIEKTTKPPATVADKEPADKGADSSKPKLSSGPLEPTKLTANPGVQPAPSESQGGPVASPPATTVTANQPGVALPSAATAATAAQTPAPGSTPTGSLAASPPSSLPDRYAGRYNLYATPNEAPSSEAATPSAATAAAAGDPFRRTVTPSAYDPAADAAALVQTAESEAQAGIDQAAAAANLPISANGVHNPLRPAESQLQPTSSEAATAATASGQGRYAIPAAGQGVGASSVPSSSGPGRYDLYGSLNGAGAAVGDANDPQRPIPSVGTPLSETAAVPLERPTGEPGRYDRYTDAVPRSANEAQAASDPHTVRPIGDMDRYNGRSAAETGTRSADLREPAALIVDNGPASPPPAILADQPLPSNTYLVAAGDNFRSISEKVYGTGAYSTALSEHNRDRYPRADLLQPGDLVSVPPIDALRASYPQFSPKPASAVATRAVEPATGGIQPHEQPQSPASVRTYVVREGDTLFDIARHELGRATRWARIYELNRETIGTDFNHLKPGVELVLPDQGAGQVPVGLRGSSSTR